MAGVDVGLVIDLGALLVSALATIAGITPPAIATKEQKSKASKDVFGQFHLASKPLIFAVQALIVAFGAVQAQAILRGHNANVSSTADATHSALQIALRKLVNKSTAVRVTSTAQHWLLNTRVRTLFRLGCLVGTLGGVLRIVCFRTLGRFFTYELAVHEGHKVVQTGPYAIVRHPSYTAMLLLWTGEIYAKAVHGPLILPVYRAAAWNAAAGGTVIVLILMALRIRDEERMLRKELGPEYEEYMRKVKSRLIPFVF